MSMHYAGRARVESGVFYGIYLLENGKTFFYPVSPDFEGFVEALEAATEIEEVLEKKSFGSFESFSYLPPTQPTKIVAVGLNYRDHAEEFGQEVPQEPLIFLKPPSSITAHLSHIIYPESARRVDYEGELAVVIKKRIKKADESEASKAIFGYSCSNDVTERFLQKMDGQWTRAKGFDTFAPYGPWISTQLRPEDGLYIRTRLNGILKQNSSTSNMIFSPQKLVSFVSKIMTLEPGDIILTGTPSGVGPLMPGDTVSVEIEGIGILTNTVSEEK